MSGTMSRVLDSLLSMVQAVFRKHGLGPRLPGLTLTRSQQLVVEAVRAGNTLVYGSPGTGKTLALTAAVIDQLQSGLKPSQLVVLAANRNAASTLRDQLALEFQGATPGPLARTLASLAFNILRENSLHLGYKVPELITGSEQEQIISELVEDFLKKPLPDDWPKHLKRQVMELRGFRHELRDLITVALEHELSPAELVETGKRLEKPEWEAMAYFYEGYVSRLREPENENRHDPSTLLTFVNKLLLQSDWPPVTTDLKLIVVDDAHELTPSAKQLLQTLCSKGAKLVLLGDPDATTMGFRAADPLSMNNLMNLVAGSNHKRIDLAEDGSGRNPRLLNVLAKTAVRINTSLGGTHRSALNVAKAAQDAVEVRVFEDSNAELAWLGNRLRQLHLLEGIAWSEMVVVSRSRAGLENLASALSAQSVPTRIEGNQAAFKDEFASGHLLALAQFCIETPAFTKDICLELMRNPFSGLDSLSIRRIRRRLRQRELDAGMTRKSDELLVELFEKDDVAKEIYGEEGKQVRRFIKSLGRAIDLAKAEGTTAYEILWALWIDSKPEREWLVISNGIGEVAMQANRNLDAIVGLFAAANRFAERHPQAGAAKFIHDQLQQDVPQDTLALGSRDLEKVMLATSASLIGKRFTVVALPQLIEGVWPNLKPRSSLLGAMALDATLSELETPTKADELSDELRMLHKAIGAASQRILVSAVDGEETQYSQFFRVFTEEIPAAQSFTEPHFTMRGMVGKLRRSLVTSTSESERLESAYGLARLAGEGIPGADPSQWAGILRLDAAQALTPIEDSASGKVWVYPSQLDNYLKCPLHWFMQAHGGTDRGFEANFGTLLHKVLEETSATDYNAIWGGVESKWNTLEFEASWVERQELRKAQRMVRNLSQYLQKRKAEGYSLVGVEVPLDVEIGNARVVGRVDRIEQSPNGELVIVDLKTGKSAPKANENAQLGLYQLAYLNGGFKEVELPEGELAGASLLLVGGDKDSLSSQASLAVDSELHDHFTTVLAESVVGMAGSEFSAQIATHCTDENSFGNCRLLLTKAVTYVG